MTDPGPALLPAVKCRFGMNALLAPLQLTAAQLGIAMFVVFVAAVVRGYSGFGFAMVAVTGLSLLRPPAEIVPMVLALEIVASAQSAPLGVGRRRLAFVALAARRHGGLDAARGVGAGECSGSGDADARIGGGADRLGGVVARVQPATKSPVRAQPLPPARLPVC